MRVNRSLLVLFASLCNFSVLAAAENCDVQQVKFELLTDMARAAAKQNNAAESVHYFKLALEADPQLRLKVLREYADQLSFNAEAHLAVPLYEEILASNPTPEDKKLALIGLARAYVWREDYKEAIKTNKQILSLDPQYNSYNFYLLIARDAAQHQHPEVAVKYYRKALAQDPTKRNELLREYAKQLSYAYQADQAIILYKDILNTDLPADEKRLIELDLAQAYIWTKQFHLALATYDELLAANPKDCEARSKLVELYVSFARFDAKEFHHTSAINWYLDAMAIDPNKRKELLREYADQVSRSGHGPEAIDLYQEFLFSGSSAEDTRLANLGLAQTYIWVNNHQEALKIYDEMLKINPRDIEAKKGKAQVYINYARYDASKGDHAKAIEWFKKAIELDPEQKSQVSKELADQLKYNSQVDEAIALYKEILDSHPNGDYERDVRLSLAKAETEKFQYDDALKQYDHLLEQNKYDGIAKQGKAKVYVDYANYNSKLGKHTEAIEWFYKALENDPIQRPELLRRIEDERSLLSNKESAPVSEEEQDIDSCSIKAPTQQHTQEPAQEQSQTKIEDQVQKNDQQTAPINPANFTEDLQTLPEEPPNMLHLSEEQQAEIQKKSINQTIEQAKYYAQNLDVYNANRAFEAALALDPNNKGNREQYAWHLQAFAFTQEAINQFYILLPEESEQTIFYQVLGWDNHTIGQLDDSIWAFSHLYDIPCDMTYANQFTLINEYYRKESYAKIHELKNSLACIDDNETFAIKKNSLNLTFTFRTCTTQIH